MVKTKKPIVLGHLNFLVYVNKLSSVSLLSDPI